MVATGRGAELGILIRRGEALRFTQLPDELPPEAVREREYCLQTGFRSHLVIPFKVGESIFGWIGFGSFRRERNWPDDLVRLQVDRTVDRRAVQ